MHASVYRFFAIDSDRIVKQCTGQAKGFLLFVQEQEEQMNSRKNVLPSAEEPAAGTVLTSKGNGISQAVKEKYNQHNRDISSKTMFGNAVLCAQF